MPLQIGIEVCDRSVQIAEVARASSNGACCATRIVLPWVSGGILTAFRADMTWTPFFNVFIGGNNHGVDVCLGESALHQQIIGVPAADL